jgi:glycerol-3-phosphate acyltransferase PlsY
MLYGLLGYICGSLPFGVWIPKWLHKGDPREGGSGNIGTTNVYRLAGIKTAAFVYVCDVLKGVLPVVVAPPSQKLSVGALCVLGHIFPLWLKFKGGKGIATACGVLLVVMPVNFFFCLVLWGMIVLFSGYVSMASLMAVLLNFALTAIFFDGSHIVFSSFLTGVLLYTHRSNLIRLWQGKETTVGSFKRGKR